MSEKPNQGGKHSLVFTGKLGDFDQRGGGRRCRSDGGGQGFDQSAVR